MKRLGFLLFAFVRLASAKRKSNYFFVNLFSIILIGTTYQSLWRDQLDLLDAKMIFKSQDFAVNVRRKLFNSTIYFDQGTAIQVVPSSNWL